MLRSVPNTLRPRIRGLPRRLLNFLPLPPLRALPHLEQAIELPNVRVRTLLSDFPPISVLPLALPDRQRVELPVQLVYQLEKREQHDVPEAGAATGALGREAVSVAALVQHVQGVGPGEVRLQGREFAVDPLQSFFGSRGVEGRGGGAAAEEANGVPCGHGHVGGGGVGGEEGEGVGVGGREGVVVEGWVNGGGGESEVQVVHDGEGLGEECPIGECGGDGGGGEVGRRDGEDGEAAGWAGWVKGRLDHGVAILRVGDGDDGDERGGDAALAQVDG